MKLEVVYKVVQVNKEGIMLSANAQFRHSRCVEYRLNHQVEPLTHTPYLFVTPDLTEAKKARRFYDQTVTGHRAAIAPPSYAVWQQVSCITAKVVTLKYHS